MGKAKPKVKYWSDRRARETRNKGNYWYGYKLIDGKLRNTYIGLSSDLKLSHLLEVGKQLGAYEV